MCDGGKEALDSVRGVKFRNCIFRGSSFLCIFIALSDPTSFGLPLLLLSHASRISILTINYFTQKNNSVIESGSKKARNLLSGPYVVPLSKADAVNST